MPNSEKKSVVVYYSWSGHTATKADEAAIKNGADLCAVEDVTKPGTLRAYTAGCFAALRMKPTPIRPLEVSLEDYDRIVIMAPVWAGHPAPAILSVFEMLPPGKEVLVRLLAGGGSSGCEEKIRKLVEKKGCTLRLFETISG